MIIKNLAIKYKLRLKRKRMLLRAIWRGYKDLRKPVPQKPKVQQNEIILITTIQNEGHRLPFFFNYYRNMGVNHFWIIDNGSTDNTQEFLSKQSDATVWTTTASYKRAAYGIHWVNAILNKYSRNNWILHVDADEFFVYPFCDTRNLHHLTHWLDATYIRSFGTLLIDMYSKKSIEQTDYTDSTNLLKATPYFDTGNYFYSYNNIYKNLWIQGGVRQRAFFHNKPRYAPSLNKIPLVKWKKGIVYISSTHMLLPRNLNVVYGKKGNQIICGCLLHIKMTQNFIAQSTNNALHQQHYAGGREYKVYQQYAQKKINLYTPYSKKYENWQQLEKLGLMSRGEWK